MIKFVCKRNPNESIIYWTPIWIIQKHEVKLNQIYDSTYKNSR